VAKTKKKQRKPKNGSGQWIDVRSASRPDTVHHVYTGDDLNGFHCTCEAFRWGTRVSSELFACKHIEQVIFGGPS